MASPTDNILPVSRQRSGQSVLRSLLLVHVLVATAGAALFGFWFGSWSAAAALWGTTAATANAVLLVWRWKRGALRTHSDAVKHLWSFFGSSLERLIVVAVLFAVGMGYVRLPALPMIAGFVLGLLSMFAFPFLSATKSLENV